MITLDLIEKRHAKFIEIIDYLNKKHRHGERTIFDCGELGFVLTWFHYSWDCEWFIPSQEFKEV